MAVTAVSDGFVMTAQTDALDNATVGDPNTGRAYVTLVKAITIDNGANPGTVTLLEGGSGGTTIFQYAPIASENIVFNFDRLMRVKDLYANAIPTGGRIIVHVA